ncbi:MAG: DUF411 domain-containing protein [Wenzhouxiangella sp.]|jgi:hypothetical protein|nr:DUF411 domain-containing protein [Wenzhouxiangella sp.]
MLSNRIRSTTLLLASVTLVAACQAQTPDETTESDAASEALEMTVYHDPNCGCCGKWADHMRANGFAVEAVPTRDMNAIKLDLGVPRNLPSCHTAVVGDYVIEGHVPANDVKRLLAEQPDAAGLSVPGMPLGSPGMEMGDRRMAYDVIRFDEDGETSVFNHYEARDGE